MKKGVQHTAPEFARETIVSRTNAMYERGYNPSMNAKNLSMKKVRFFRKTRVFSECKFTMLRLLARVYKHV